MMMIIIIAADNQIIIAAMIIAAAAANTLGAEYVLLPIVLALVGAHLQDRKKARHQPDSWPQWMARTSFLPFAARRSIRGLGGHALGGGVVVWLAATWAHIPLAGWAAGVWRWIA